MKSKKKNDIIMTIAITLGAVAIIGIIILAFVVDDKKQNSGYVIEKTYSELQDVIKEKERNVILVGRDNCSHCISYRPVIEDVAKQYEIKVYYINTNTIENEKDFDALWAFVGTDGTPTTAIVEDGKLVAVEDGELTRSQLIAFLKANEIVKK